MSAQLAVERLAGAATLPYRRGAETLELELLAPDVDGWTPVKPYGFPGYRARWGAEPAAPRYLLVPRFAIGRDPLPVEIEVQRGSAHSVLTLTLPPGTPAGLSFAVPLADSDGPALRITRLRPLGTVPSGPGASHFRLLALLGNLAKLLWVAGCEQDALDVLLDEVRRQRHVGTARGASLDLHGRDLRVSRFPPREHSFDRALLALYHFNEEKVAAGRTFADETKRFGRPGHPATAAGEVSGGRGKFGPGLALPGPTGDGHLVIPHHADFDLPAGGNFTLDLFAQPAPAKPPGDTVRALVAKGGLDAGGNLAGDGWALTLGSFRGLDNNLRWQVRAGTAGCELFADLDLADGDFHHLAATVDGAGSRARLFVDGVERASAGIERRPAVANGEAVRVGRSASGHQLTGRLDELRFSTAARSDFHPVLGEGDEAYRRRLAIFGGWLLPTPEELLAALNGAVTIADDPAPLVLIERDRPLATAAREIRVVPATLPAGGHIDADGDPQSTVEEACGRPQDEPGFEPAVLFRHDRAQVLYAAESARLVHRAAAGALDALVDLLAALPATGKLKVEAAFDPQAASLQRVGRALVLQHQTVTPGDLAALAHRAGFDWVEHRPGRVFAAVATAPHLGVHGEPPPPAERPAAGDLFVGKELVVALQPPSLPVNALPDWSLIRCGRGRARLAPLPGEGDRVRHQRRLRLVAEAPGEIVVSVEVRLTRTTFTGSCTVRIVPADLADGDHIAADGDTALSEEESVGRPEAGFNPAFLVRHASGVTFAAGADPRMQVALDRTLGRLAGLLEPLAELPKLTVLLAFVPGRPDLHGVGRALRLKHDVLTAGQLAALAHQAGFGWVKREGAEVHAAVAAGAALEIVQDPGGQPLPAELVIGRPLPLRVRQDFRPADALNWSVDPIALGRALLSTVLRPQTILSGTAPGLAAVTVFHLVAEAGATAPYSFEVRLNPDLERANAVVPKPEYDLIMNILHYFHPLGIEVLTRRLRDHVVEVRDSQQPNAFPGYTFPDFRV